MLRFRIAESFQERIAEQQLLLDGFQMKRPAADRHDVLHDQFGRFCLARTAFARQHDHLVGVEVAQRTPRSVSQ